MKPTLKAIIIVAAISCLIIIPLAVYASITYVPTDNNLEHLDPLPTYTPTATTTPTATPTPTIETQVIGGTITGNDTDTNGDYIFHKGDTMHIIVQTNSTIPGREVQIFNNDNFVISIYTDATGKAECFRTVNNPYNYIGKIAQEVPAT